MQLPSEMFAEVVIKRHVAGAYVAGRWVAAAPAELTIVACVEPAGPREMTWAPEGEWVHGGITIHTESPLQVADTATGTNADLIVWDGGEWQVCKVEHFVRGSNHYRALAVL